jgi:hypothetical protein
MFFPLYALKITLSTFKKFPWNFPQFKATFAADTLSSHAPHFAGTPKSQMEQYTFALNKIFLNNHVCYRTIQAEND